MKQSYKRLMGLLFFVLLLVGCAKPDVEPLVAESLMVQEAQAMDVASKEAYPPPEDTFEHRELEERQAAYPVPIEVPATPNPTLPIDTPNVAVCDFTGSKLEELDTGRSLQIELSRPLIIKTNLIGFQAASWLPDNKSLLLMQNGKEKQTVSILNVMTGEEKIYAEREATYGNPVWLDAHQGVAFADLTEDGWELKFSKGEDVISQLHPKIASVHVSVNPGTNLLTTLIDNNVNEIVQIDLEKMISPVSKDAIYSVGSSVPNSVEDMTRVVWADSGGRFVAYSSSQLRIVDQGKGIDCQLNLQNYRERGEGRVLRAKWSPDSRFLGLVLYAENFPKTEFAVLDVINKEFHIIDQYFSSDDTAIPFTVNDFVWNPDSTSIIAKAHTHNNDAEAYHFVSIDTESGRGVMLIPNYSFNGSGASLALSNDGELLAYRCPTETAGQLCLIEVNQASRK